MWRTYLFAGSPEVTPRLSPFWLLAISATSPATAGLGATLLTALVPLGVEPSSSAAACSRSASSRADRRPGGLSPRPDSSSSGKDSSYPTIWRGFLGCSGRGQDGAAARPWAGAVLGGATFLVLVKRPIGRCRTDPLKLGALRGLVLDRPIRQAASSGAIRGEAFPKRAASAPRPGRRRAVLGPALRAGVALAAGWGLGFLLAGPYLLPFLEYTATGSRMARRSEGVEERPPVGLAALPQVVLPDMYGSTQIGSFYLSVPGQGNQLESSAAAYAGLLATLLVAPLAWCSRRHRSIDVFWLILIVLSLRGC